MLGKQVKTLPLTKLQLFHLPKHKIDELRKFS